VLRKLLLATAAAVLAVTGLTLAMPAANAAPVGFVSRSGAGFVLSGLGVRQDRGR